MSKIVLGLDIGTYTVKAVQLSKEKTFSRLLSAGYIPNPLPSLNFTSDHDEKVLAGRINRLVHEMKSATTEVVASLPSTKVITRIVEVPEMKEEELSASIEWEAEQYIPWPLSQVKIDFAIVEKNISPGKMKVLVAAAPSNLVKKYMDVISFSGLTPLALEPEILATVRATSESLPDLANILLVSIGASATEIALIREKILVFTKSYPVGGNILTQTIAEDLGFEIPQAEEYKKTYGLDEEKLEGKIAKIITPFFLNIFGEIEKTLTYFKEQYPKEEIKVIAVSGGTAKLPQLMTLITKNLGIDSQISNPFLNLVVDPNILPIISPDAPIYTTAVGLALKEENQ